MGVDSKYGMVTTAHGDIPEDEPVIVFRGRDAMVPSMLDYYLAQCQAHGSPQRHIDLVTHSKEKIEAWQRDHPDRTRQPDSERSRAWLGDAV
jgi:hypothetical protein